MGQAKPMGYWFPGSSLTQCVNRRLVGTIQKPALWEVLNVAGRICQLPSLIRLSSALLLRKACNRPLGAPLAQIEGSTNLGPRRPVRPQRSHTQSVHLDARPSKLLALGARIPQPGPNPLLDQ